MIIDIVIVEQKRLRKWIGSVPAKPG